MRHPHKVVAGLAIACGVMVMALVRVPGRPLASLPDHGRLDVPEDVPAPLRAAPAVPTVEPETNDRVPASPAERIGVQARAAIRFVGGRPWILEGRSQGFAPVTIAGDDGAVLGRHTPTPASHGGRVEGCELFLPDSVGTLTFDVPGFRAVELTLPAARRDPFDLGEVVLVADAAVVVCMSPLPSLTEPWLRAQVIRGTQGEGDPRVTQFHVRGDSAEAKLEVRIPVPSGDAFFVAVGPDDESPAGGFAMMPQVSEVFTLAPGQERRVDFHLGGTATVQGRLVGIDPGCVENLEIAAWLQADDPRYDLDLPVSFRRTTRTDREGRFAMHGFRPGMASLRLQSYSHFTLVESGTRRARWRLPVDRELLVAPALPAVGVILTRGGSRLGEPHALSLGEPAGADGMHTEVGFFERDALSRYSRLFVFAERVGHSSVFTRTLNVGADGLVRIEVTGGSGSILVRNEQARSLSWKLTARQAGSAETVFPFDGFPARVTAEGWLIEQLEPGDYRLHFFDDPKWSRRADLPGVYRVRNGELTEVVAEPPRFVEVEVRVSNWEEIPEHLRPDSVGFGRARGKIDNGTARIELPEPVENHLEATFLGRTFVPPVTTRDITIADGVILVGFPVSRLGIALTVQPRFSGATRLAVFLPINPGEPKWGTRELQVEGDAAGAFTLATTGDGEPLLGRIWEHHPELDREIPRGWFRISGGPQRIEMDPGGRWVRVSLAEKSDSCRVSVRGPAFADAVTVFDFGLPLTGAAPDSVWIPDGARALVFRSAHQGEVVVPVDEIEETLRVELPYR